MKSNSKVVHLLSGGLDSVVLLKQLVLAEREVFCVLVDYRQPHAKELWFAEKWCKKLKCDYTIIDLPELGGLKGGKWIVDSRNCILLGHAAHIASRHGIHCVTIGCNKDDAAMFPDCRIEFIESYNAVLKASCMNVRVEAPLIEMTKSEILIMAKNTNINLSEVWSCYLGKDKPCGICPACKKLKEALCGQ